MKIVVVIVTYNPKKWLEKCLNSIMQSTIFLETIIIDNKSTDGSPLIIKNKFPEVTLIESNENLGFGRGNNIGIAKAFSDGADYVFLLNQDAWIQPDTITDLMIAHQKEPQFGIVSPMHLNGNGNALDYKFSKYINPERCYNLYSDIFLNIIKKKIYPVNFINAAAWLISRECLEIVGGFNPSFFHYGEDDNYVQRIKFHGFKIGVCPNSIIYHDRETTSENRYFTDDKIVYSRSVILNMSNPINQFFFGKEYKKCYASLCKSLVLFKKKEIIQFFKRIKMLNHLNKKQIIKNREESCKMQPSFLNIK
ncbi:glycosyltransferase family 2 protein [Flavobacterium hibisci]|uniref:glycosyltransferase family 2 protein n=1 Tax=Flavobacterium hibisci TaxID=1914462 RepID=UPI001CBF1AC1|nr:glycosyltransferase family 2 protein [Flavobacterium hibisci]MBZ4041951.1 glycosyltransferase family 2 protein [Flavobacterium hibisci]